MPDYPTTSFNPATRSAGQTIAAAHMNDVQAEIRALELALLDAATGLTLTSGQIIFPATQNASAGANTLDDYEEGTWTPVLTFATAGNLSVAYSIQLGRYTKIGRLFWLTFAVVTSTFTHTTASGACQLTGSPFTGATDVEHAGTVSLQGVTKANYTHFTARMNGAVTIVDFTANGSAQSRDNINAADMPTGGTVNLYGNVMGFV